MSELKASPGPWEYVAKLSPSENHRGFFRGFFIRAEKATRNGKWALAEVQPGDEDGKLGKANAALIAAAPDMYQELTHIENELFGIVEALRMDGRLIGAMTKAGAANALAALEARCIAIQAKARGE